MAAPWVPARWLSAELRSRLLNRKGWHRSHPRPPGIDNHSHSQSNSGTPTLLAAAVYVCLCYGITDRTIREAAAGGARSLSELSALTGCGTSCGSCRELAEEILESTRAAPLGLPVFAAAA